MKDNVKAVLVNNIYYEKLDNGKWKSALNLYFENELDRLISKARTVKYIYNEPEKVVEEPKVEEKAEKTEENHVFASLKSSKKNKNEEILL